jgi:hypothetical protein
MKRLKPPRVGETTQYSWSGADESHYLDLDGDTDRYHVYARIRLIMTRPGLYSVKAVRICVIWEDDYDSPYAEFQVEYGPDTKNRMPSLSRDGLRLWLVGFTWKEIWEQMQQSLEHVTGVHRLVGGECKRALAGLAASLRALPS